MKPKRKGRTCGLMPPKANTCFYLHCARIWQNCSKFDHHQLPNIVQMRPTTTTTRRTKSREEEVARGRGGNCELVLTARSFGLLPDVLVLVLTCTSNGAPTCLSHAPCNLSVGLTFPRSRSSRTGAVQSCSCSCI